MYVSRREFSATFCIRYCIACKTNRSFKPKSKSPICETCKAWGWTKAKVAKRDKQQEEKESNTHD